LKPTGGDSLREKAQHLFFFPYHLQQIKSCLKESDWLHFRAPTGIGVLFLPWIFFFWKHGTWIKYAGSWKDRAAPLSYKFQRWFLKRFPIRVKIAVNGVFNDLQGNFLDFRNPCFDKNTLHRAKGAANKKDFNGKLDLLFVGRLEQAKGLDDLLSLIEKMDRTDKINSLTIIGESKTLSKYENWAERIPIKVIFSGLLSRKDVFRHYARSHILVLVSKTEGFPKVIMEAGAFGCVSIVSDLPQIRNVIKHGHNGFILQSDLGFIDHQNFQTILNDIDKLNFCSKNINSDAKDFTFEKYISAIENAVLH
jgi:glycosyltransferase involved in cell wall biosynthesis